MSETPSDTSTDGLWDADDVAEYLKVGKRTVYRWQEEQGLPSVKVGRLTRFVPDDVREWATKAGEAT